mmetsp:Transcript_7686/g.21025  ORF Transcript_7686/g.21025 Transcript_7686/m.21025 type:complete len:396 (+) Transcript_7686:123-1310(+)
MGIAASKSAHRLDKALGTSVPEDEHFFGLENFGNTCYANSVLQALYYCPPFREACIAHVQAKDHREEDLLQCLCELFHTIHSQKKRCGVLPPRKFIHKLREENELFRSNMHQDAHEFLNYLLNESTEILEGRKKGASPNHAAPAAADGGAADDKKKAKTWVHTIFEGTLTNETKCLTCETVTTRDEDFLDLSLDIEQNSSLSSCLRSFSCSESLRDGDKYYCDTCCSLQEAQKRMRIKRMPPVLALHLKRFKYMEQLGRYKKLSYRVMFPQELRVPGVVAAPIGPDGEPTESQEEEVVYDLFAVVIHVGQGPNHGHYVSIVKAHNRWLLFDDDTVELIDEQHIAACYGTSQDGTQNTDVGYLLFYQARNVQLPSLAPTEKTERPQAARAPKPDPA